MSRASLAVPPEEGGAVAAAPRAATTRPREGELGLVRALTGGLSRILASQLALIGAGVATLPVLARHFGPAVYGAFSLYVTVLGVVSNLDFARPILVRELSIGGGAERRNPRLASLAAGNAWFLAAAACGAGFVVLGPIAGLALAVAALLHGLASSSFGALSAAGRVASAAMVRNVAWTGALLAVTALSFGVHDVHAYAWAFVVANLAILLLYRRMVRAVGTVRPEGAGLRSFRSEAWPAHGREVRDLLGFSLSSGVVVSADRMILTSTASEAVAGEYIAHTDLAVKMNAVGTALGTLLYPLFARDVGRRGLEAAARRFVRLAGWIALGWFALILGLMLLERDVVRLALGGAFLAHRGIYVLTLVGVFLHLWGFLLTPWQRARGEFAAQRRAYNVAALVMLATGLLLIPRLGAVGAILSYLSARTAELLLVAHELRTLPRSVLPAWKPLALAAMLAVLVGTALVRASGAL